MEEDSHHHHGHDNLTAVAVSATLHCLTGCAIGEIAGMIIGTAFGLSNLATIVLSIALAFALAIAGVVAVPVNRWLIARGKGHAVVHETGIHGGPPRSGG